MSDIKDISKAVHQNARDKGWWLPYAKENAIRELSPDQVLSKLMLVVSELSEACEEIRDPKCDPRRVYFLNPSGEKVDHAKWKEFWDEAAGMPKPEGFPIEMADAVIRVFDLCEAMGVDLAAAIELKHEYNKSRPNRHGNKRA